jgi:hypothetical protein
MRIWAAVFVSTLVAGGAVSGMNADRRRRSTVPVDLRFATHMLTIRDTYSFDLRRSCVRGAAGAGRWPASGTAGAAGHTSTCMMNGRSENGISALPDELVGTNLRRWLRAEGLSGQGFG